MEEQKIPRNINKPMKISIIGLEVLEVGYTVFTPLILIYLIFDEEIIALLSVIVFNFIYVKARKGKPPGWIFHWLYKTGFRVFGVQIFHLRGLLNARVKNFEISPGIKNNLKEYRLFGKEEKILRSVRC